MKLSIKTIGVLVLMICSFLGGFKYAQIKLNSMLLSTRINDLRSEVVTPEDAVQSINDDMRRISEERELLKKHVEINNKYLEKNDIDGLRRWTSKMRAELSK